MFERPPSDRDSGRYYQTWDCSVLGLYKNCTIPETGLSYKKAVTRGFEPRPLPQHPCRLHSPGVLSFATLNPLLSVHPVLLCQQDPQTSPDHWKCSVSPRRAGTWSRLSLSSQHPARGRPCLPLLPRPPGHSPPRLGLTASSVAGPPGAGMPVSILQQRRLRLQEARPEVTDTGSRRGRAGTDWEHLEPLPASLNHRFCPAAEGLGPGRAPWLGVRKLVSTLDLDQNVGLPVQKGDRSFHQHFQSYPGPKTIKRNWPGDIFFLSFSLD